MKLRTFTATLFMTAALSSLPPSRVSAQSGAKPAPAPPPSAAPAPDPAAFDRQSAQETRERLHELLLDYPPSLTQVLRLDPSLLTNQTFMAPYPALTAFLAQHPAVVRTPAFFLGDGGYRMFPERNSRQETINALEEMAIGVGVFLFFMTALGVVAYISRAMLEHRRWVHATKVQTDAHTRLVERLTSNEDLLAYVQSPAGMRFLSATPISPEPESRLGGTGAPVGRILTSVQIGIVGAFAGLGLGIAKTRVIEEVAQPLHVISVLALALGVGFVVSAVVSFVLSKQLGLIRSSSDA